MEKVTITKLGEAKHTAGTSPKTGRAYAFDKIGFQCKEYPDRWNNFIFDMMKAPHGLEVGKEYEFEFTSKDYNGKTYWDAKLPKKEDRIEDMVKRVVEQNEMILNRLVGIKMDLLGIRGFVEPKTKSGAHTTEAVEYPVNELPEPFPDEPL